VRWVFRLCDHGKRPQRGGRPAEALQCQQSAWQDYLLAGLAGPGTGLIPENPLGETAADGRRFFFFDQ